MKCLETERLISYAYRLTDEPAASKVRAHLEECARCREIVEQHGRLDAVLNEWKIAEPTPEFDARVRQAVEARQAGRAAWGFWGWSWARGLALASLGGFDGCRSGMVHPEPSPGFQPAAGCGATTTAGWRRAEPGAVGERSPSRRQTPCGCANCRTCHGTSIGRKFLKRRQIRPIVGRL